MVLFDKKLELFVQTVRNKKIDEFTKEDYESFQVLSYEGDTSSEKPIVNFQDISSFLNVSRVVVTNAFITTGNIKFLVEKNIKEITFNHCLFENDMDLSLMVDLCSIELIRCFNSSYDFFESLRNLNTLTIIKPYTEVPISLSFLNQMEDIQSLTLQGCSIDDFSCLASCKKICYLNVISSDIPLNPVETFRQMSSLREIYISKRHHLKELPANIIVKNNFDDSLFDSK